MGTRWSGRSRAPVKEAKRLTSFPSLSSEPLHSNFKELHFMSRDDPQVSVNHQIQSFRKSEVILGSRTPGFYS